MAPPGNEKESCMALARLPDAPFTHVVCHAGQSAFLLWPTVNTGFSVSLSQIEIVAEFARRLIELVPSSATQEHSSPLSAPQRCGRTTPSASRPCSTDG